jgi:hypothetical protein
MGMRIAFRVAVGIVVTSFLVSSFLFWKSGGFGGGHDRYDLPIGLLASPWIFILPEPIWDLCGDLGAVVVAPFLINISGIAVLWLAFGRKRKTSPVQKH